MEVEYEVYRIRKSNLLIFILKKKVTNCIFTYDLFIHKTVNGPNYWCGETGRCLLHCACITSILIQERLFWTIVRLQFLLKVKDLLLRVFKQEVTSLFFFKKIAQSVINLYKQVDVGFELQSYLAKLKRNRSTVDYSMYSPDN